MSLARNGPNDRDLPDDAPPKNRAWVPAGRLQEDIVKAFSIIRSTSGDIEQARKCRRLVTVGMTVRAC
jgi:hypothetical protein